MKGLALLTYRSRFTFDGHANFLDPDRQQSVSVDLSSLSGILAAYVDLPGFARQSGLSLGQVVTQAVTAFLDTFRQRRG